MVGGARRVLDAARRAGLPVGVVTASPRRVLELFLSRTGLSDFFDVVLSGEDPEIRENKPAPDVYLAGTGRLGVEPAAALAFEDSAGGVRSASAAGIRVAVIRTPQNRGVDFSGFSPWLVLEGGFPEFDVSVFDGRGRRGG